MEVMDSGGLLDTATNFVYVSIINTSPVADFTVDPDSGNTNTVFHFDASTSYHNQDTSLVLQVRWDWENDNNWDSDYSTLKTANHQFADSGLKYIALEVKDSGGLRDTLVKQLYIAHVNTPPQALFTINPDSGDIDDIFEFNASTSFDDEDKLADLMLRWDWQNDGIWDTEYSLSKIITHQYLNTGIKYISLEVKDTGGLTDTVINRLIVSVPNTPPRATFTVNLTSGTTSTIFEVDASDSWDDQDSTILQFRWDWEDDGTWDTNYTMEKTALHQYEEEGIKTIKLQVKDSGGLTAFAINQVTVSDVPFTDTKVTDIDDNIYKIVKIGEQYWMAENLKVTHYRNGDEIPKVLDNTEWTNLVSGACCIYDNNDEYIGTYGLLYNWYAVDDSRKIAPEGWHIPSNAEWNTLIEKLGGDQYAGGKMKSSGTTYWQSPNTGANNESGFSALPGGGRNRNGGFGDVGYAAIFWIEEFEFTRGLNYNGTEVSGSVMFKRDGASIRCVKD